MAEATEPRRRLLVVLSTLGLAAVAACDKPNSHDSAASALDDLSSAVDNLDQTIARFDDDNWRDVVPDVRSAADNVASAADRLRDLLSDNDDG